MLTNSTQIQAWLEKMQIKYYSIEPNLTVNVEQNVNLKAMNLSAIPVQFGEVKGAFIIQNNQLTSLKGVPHIIHGSFNCSGNKLEKLDYLPQKIKKNFSCDSNQLKTLEGLEKVEIAGSISCTLNQLQDLKGLPLIIHGSVNCSFNKINTLKFFPKEIKEHFNIRKNNLTTTKGIKEIKGNIILSQNRITHLEDLQAYVKGNLFLERNHLKNLLGLSQKIGGSLFLGHNPLYSLEGISQNIKNKVYISNELLSEKDYLPLLNVKCSDFYFNEAPRLKNLKMNYLGFDSIDTQNASDENLYLVSHDDLIPCLEKIKLEKTISNAVIKNPIVKI